MIGHSGATAGVSYVSAWVVGQRVREVVSWARGLGSRERKASNGILGRGCREGGYIC